MQTTTSLNVPESLKHSHIIPCLWSGIQVSHAHPQGFVSPSWSQTLVFRWQLLHRLQLLSALSFSSWACACCSSLLMQYVRAYCRHSWLWGLFFPTHHRAVQFLSQTDLPPGHQQFGPWQSLLAHSCCRWRCWLSPLMVHQLSSGLCRSDLVDLIDFKVKHVFLCAVSLVLSADVQSSAEIHIHCWSVKETYIWNSHTVLYVRVCIKVNAVSELL